MTTAESKYINRILALNQVGLKIQKELNVGDIYRIIGEGLREIGLDCGIMLLDEEEKNLRLEALSSLASLVAKGEKLLGVKAVGFSIPIENETAVTTAIKENRAVYTKKASDMIKEMVPSLRHAPLVGHAAKIIGLHHAIAAPLVARGKAFGALCVYSRDIAEEEIPVVVAFANQAAIAIDNTVRLPSEFKASAKELAESEEKYRRLTEAINDGYIVYHTKGVVFANHRFAEMFGYTTAAEVLGKDFFTFVEPESLQEIAEIYARVMSGEEDIPERYEINGVKRDGTKIIVDLSIKAIDYEGESAFSVIFRDVTEQKQSEKNYRRLLEEISDGYIVYQGTGIAFANHRFAEIFGYTVDDVLGKDMFTFMPPDNFDPIFEKHSSIVSGEEAAPQRYEIEAVKKDGTRIIVDLSTKQIEYEGKPAYSIIFRDITKRKKAEERLQRSEEQFRLLIENSYDVIIVVGADAAINYISPSVERVIGYKPEELIGKQSTNFIHSDDLPHFMDALVSVVETPGHAESREVRILHKNGSWRTVHGTGVSLLAEPSVTGIVINFKDITEQKQVEEKHRLLVEDMNDGYVVVQDMKCVFANRSFIEMTGYDAEKVIGMSALELLPPDNRQTVTEQYEKVVRGEETPVDRFESVRTAEDGTLVISESSIKAIEYEGKPAFGVIVRDITERKQAEEALHASEREVRKLNAELEQRVIERTRELEAANKELEAFSYSVSHDLRAPLRSIDGFSQVILEDYADKLDEEGADYLKRLRAASQRMGYLIDDMLKLSRVTRSNMQYVKVDLSALARSITDELKQYKPERKIEFIITDGMTVRGDPQLLGIALENLLENAWKFTGKRDHATIEFGFMEVEDDGRKAYYVRDDGVGFDMTYADKLFGAFQRLHAPTDFEGTGIGLATVQRIIHRHGGKVWGEGVVDQGATFYFTLNNKKEGKNGG